MASSTFDPELIEFRLHTGDGDLVEVYKVGGGTPGRADGGLWGYRHVSKDIEIAVGDDLHTGTPKTHQETALLVIEFSNHDKE